MKENLTPGKQIERLCREQGISQKMLAERIGVSPSQISRIIREETKSVSSEMLMKLAEVFQVSTDEILGMKPNQKDRKEKETYLPMMLMNTAFEPGKCREFMDSTEDPDIRNMVYAEYAYFSGQHEKAVKLAGKYLTNPNPLMALSACLIYSFANLTLNHISQARQGLDMIAGSLKSYEKNRSGDRKQEALLVFMSAASRVLLHLPAEEMPQLSDYIGELPEGMRLWGCYVMAHEAYLNQQYEKSLGIVQACLALTGKIYPIAEIYLRLVAAMDAMSLRDQELARTYFMEAWELARPDDLIEGIGEHHGLLQGLIETCMKEAYPEDYRRIIEITYRFSYGWRRIHNPDTNEEVADNLTTTEFTIAMLASRGWTNGEIAEYMKMTERTVKQHLTATFNKLNINNRKQLVDYMLR